MHFVAPSIASDRLVLVAAADGEQQEHESANQWNENISRQPQVRFHLSNQQTQQQQSRIKLNYSQKRIRRKFASTTSNQIRESARRLQAGVQLGGRRMIDHFSEFLAKRNVIPAQDDTNVSNIPNNTNTTRATTATATTTTETTTTMSSQRRRYDKFNEEEHNQNNNNNNNELRSSHRSSYFSHHHHPIRFAHNYGEQNNNHNLEFYRHSYGYNKDYNDNLSKKHKRSRVVQTLSALLNRNQRNKASLLVSLLRAPAFLAALFSLVLVLTLMILYTLSFHNHLQRDLLRGHLQERTLNFNHHLELDGGSNLRKQNNDAPSDLLPAPRHSTSYQFASSSMRQMRESEAAMMSEESESLMDSSYDQEKLRNEDKENGSNRAGTSRTSNSFTRALTIQTECGPYTGRPEGKAIVFRGIPYASPPIGERRWTRPRPIWLDPELCDSNSTPESNHLFSAPKSRLEVEAGDIDSQGERRPSGEDMRNKQHCAQLSPMTHRFTGHEDCLYLDIYAPKLGDQFKKLPVMVYIHGGFLAYGSGRAARASESGSRNSLNVSDDDDGGDDNDGVNWMRARPSGTLAAEMDVIFVAFNFRLQALGFMALEQLAQNNGPEGGEGNYGLWDQLVALQWIKRNIESFGGDPNNIVIFGPDSASALPLALLLRNSRDNNNSDNEINSNPRSSKSKSRVNLSNIASELPFRAAWLTNPTVYYNFPYEKANGHYERLLVSQSSCYSNGINKTINRSGNRPIARNQMAASTTEAAAIIETTRNGGGSARGAREDGNKQANQLNETTTTTTTTTKATTKTRLPLVECLVRSSGEQIVRQYLGNDDPAYRLDDQNSLPINGILADQFVTVDRELVSLWSSYPLLVIASNATATAAATAAAATTTTTTFTADQQNQSDSAKFVSAYDGDLVAKSGTNESSGKLIEGSNNNFASLVANSTELNQRKQHHYHYHRPTSPMANEIAEASGLISQQQGDFGVASSAQTSTSTLSHDHDHQYQHNEPKAAGGRHIGRPDNCPEGSICDATRAMGEVEQQTKASIGLSSSITTTTKATTTQVATIATTTGKSDPVSTDPPVSSDGFASHKHKLSAQKLGLPETTTTTTTTTTKTAAAKANTFSGQPRGKTNQGGDLSNGSTSKLAGQIPLELAASNQVGVESRNRKLAPSLLIGSTAQAVEYWPCPRDLDSWSWAHFKSYVSTSLNSFSMDTYKEASNLYLVPEATTTKMSNSLPESSPVIQQLQSKSPRLPQSPKVNQQIDVHNVEADVTKGPKETYLSMVSDIRQICPINELAKSLETQHQLKVSRYIVETPPSSSLRELRRVNPKGNRSLPSKANANVNSLDLEAEKKEKQDLEAGELYESKQEFAFHMWDLIAFFGFEFEAPEFKPTARDLEFQRQVRKMVKKFVHQTPVEPRELTTGANQQQQHLTGKGEASGKSEAGAGDESGKLKLFTKAAKVELVDSDNYKQLECSMWQRQLGRSHAWVS